MAATKGSEQEVTRFSFNFHRVNRSGVELRSDNSGLRAGGGRPIAGAQTEMVGAVEVGRSGQILDDI